MESLSLATGALTGAEARSEWERLAAEVLRKSGRLGADDPDAAAWAALTRRTLDGLEITPLGTPELDRELRTSGRPRRRGDWDVRAQFCDPDPARTREELLTDLENGATSVWLRLGAGQIATEDLATVLAPVLVDVAPVVLEAAGTVADQFAAARAFVDHVAGQRAGQVAHAGVAEDANLGIDPAGAKIRTGGFPDGFGPLSDDAPIHEAGRLAGRLGCRALVVDGTAVHDLGASDVQELGYLVAVGATYLRGLVADGHDAAAAARLLEFRVAVTDEQFPSIAKLRALRRLWDRVLELSGVPADSAARTDGVRVHAVTSRPMMSKYDPWVNMLRTCVAAFAAGVAGADAVTVLPFDVRLGRSDAFARRIARNTSSLLFAESHVGAVADPAGGSHLVESLTDDLAVAGWEELGRIEGTDGSLSGLAELAGRIARVVAERDRQVATRKRPLTGLTEFPNLRETLPERPALPEGTGACGSEQVRSYGHAFEELRDHPVESPVFLATMGSVAAHTARATFAANLFAAGGMDVVNEGAHEDVDAVLAHYSGQKLVCLTGTDAAYQEWGDDLVAALREAGAAWVIVAGKPMDAADDNCALGMDALDFLTRTRSKLEESR